MEFSLNDINDIDYQGQLEQKKAKLQHEMRLLSSQLVFPTPIRTAIGMGAVAHHFTKSLIPTIAGALIGYKIHEKRTLSEIDKQVIMNKINTKRKQIEQLEKVDAQNTQEIDGIMSAESLMNYDYPHYTFTGKWQRFIGDPQIGFHAMVYGIPKSGKSILCTQFAQYLSENFGSVLYVAAEEGFSMTLQKKIQEFGMANENLFYANFKDAQQIATALENNNFDFVFIDSVNYIKIEPEELEQLKAIKPETSWITIQQATKDGKFRGSQEFAHNCDVVIQVSQGVATQQGRFHEPSAMRVFPDGEFSSEPVFADDEEGDTKEKPSQVQGFDNSEFELDF
jgi:adenosyl cobinamide kinase/adenosyl cobinamide phosphate guanylyltransferase